MGRYGKLFLAVVLALGVVLLYRPIFTANVVRVEAVLNAPGKTDYQLFYQGLGEKGFNEQHSIHLSNRNIGVPEKLVFKVPIGTIQGLRLDFGDGSSPDNIFF